MSPEVVKIVSERESKLFFIIIKAIPHVLSEGQTVLMKRDQGMMIMTVWR